MYYFHVQNTLFLFSLLFNCCPLPILFIQHLKYLFPVFCLQDFIKSAFQDIVSAELEKMNKDSSSNDNVAISTSVPEPNHALDLWEYDGLSNAYRGDCEEILLEMQRIFYEDLSTEPTKKGET